MTIQELQTQALQLSIGDRWRLVKFLLNSIQEETLQCDSQKQNVKLLPNLDPWTQDLM